MSVVLALLLCVSLGMGIITDEIVDAASTNDVARVQSYLKQRVAPESQALALTEAIRHEFSEIVGLLLTKPVGLSRIYPGNTRPDRVLAMKEAITNSSPEVMRVIAQHTSAAKMSSRMLVFALQQTRELPKFEVLLDFGYPISSDAIGLAAAKSMVPLLHRFLDHTEYIQGAIKRAFVYACDVLVERHDDPSLAGLELLLESPEVDAEFVTDVFEVILIDHSTCVWLLNWFTMLEFITKPTLQGFLDLAITHGVDNQVFNGPMIDFLVFHGATVSFPLLGNDITNAYHPGGHTIVRCILEQGLLTEDQQLLGFELTVELGLYSIAALLAPRDRMNELYQGSRLLHYAAQTGDMVMVDRVLIKGADPTLLDYEGKSFITQLAIDPQDYDETVLGNYGTHFFCEQTRTLYNSLQQVQGVSSIIRRIRSLSEDTAREVMSHLYGQGMTYALDSSTRALEHRHQQPGGIVPI